MGRLGLLGLLGSALLLRLLDCCLWLSCVAWLLCMCCLAAVHVLSVVPAGMHLLSQGGSGEVLPCTCTLCCCMITCSIVGVMQAWANQVPTKCQPSANQAAAPLLSHC